MDNTKILVLMRGLPGSGKSKEAEVIRRYFAEKYLRTSICSMSKWFMYEPYSREEERKAARNLQIQVTNEMLKGVNVIIVDASNIHLHDYINLRDVGEIRHYVVFQELMMGKTIDDCLESTCFDIDRSIMENMQRSFYYDQELPILSQHYNYRK